MAADWSYLPEDLLKLIVEKLDLVDHSGFASVCSWWTSVAVENPPINKPLYLALSHRPKRLLRGFITSFIPSWTEARFIGALDEWLVILIDSRDLFLLNKGLNSIIPLPTPPDPNNFFERGLLCKAVLSSAPSSSLSSSGECTVFLKGRRLSYCRLGSDNSFTRLLDNSYIIWDIEFYKGRLYVLRFPGIIIIFNHLFNKVKQLATHTGDITECNNLGLTQFVISGNRLLIVSGWRAQVKVFKFERSKSSVVPAKNIKDTLLLLNHFCSLSIGADEHKEFRRNYHSKKKFGTYILDMGKVSKDPYRAKKGDPCPLFFYIFKQSGIENERLNGP